MKVVLDCIVMIIDVVKCGEFNMNHGICSDVGVGLIE